MAANVTEFGATPGSDSTAAFQRAIAAAAGAIYVPGQDTYPISQPLSVPQGFSIVGDGDYSSVIVNTTPDKPTLPISGINFGTIRDIKLDRAVRAVAGGNGIDTTAGVENLTVEGVSVWNNFINFALGSTDWSVLKDIEAQKAISHGFSLIGGPLQYEIYNALAEGCGGDGLYAQARPGFTGGAPMGEINVFQTYQNGGVGMRLLGTPAVPLGAVRLKNLFLGSDGDWELYIDPGGGDIKITASTIEFAKTGGLFVSNTATFVDISQLDISDCNYHGALIYADYWTWSGGRSLNNKGSGVGFMRGRGTVLGGHYLLNQNFGVYFDPSAQGAAYGINCVQNGMGTYNTVPGVVVRDSF